MKWINEPWRKLYTRITGEWLQLSVMARGLADELLKYAKDDGSICDTRGADPGLCVALLVSAKPYEVSAVQAAVPELIEDGFLVLDGTRLKIKNLAEAQERKSAAAIRQERYRENLKSVTEGVTRDVTVTPNVTPNVTHNVTPDCDAERKKERESSLARTRVISPEQQWMDGTGTWPGAGLYDAIILSRETATAKGEPPDEYFVRALNAFSQWVDGCRPGRRPQKSPQKFVEHFARVQEILDGKRKAVPDESPLPHGAKTAKDTGAARELAERIKAKRAAQSAAIDAANGKT